MALKDWKRIAVNKYKRIHKFGEIEVDYSTISSNKKPSWNVIIEPKEGHVATFKLKSFSDALKYARAYMKTH